MKKIGILFLTFMFASTFSCYAQQEDVRDNVWQAEYSEKLGAMASVNGLVTYGDKLIFRFHKNQCDSADMMFTFYTHIKNKNILKLDEKAVNVLLNDQITPAKIFYPHIFILGYSALFNTPAQSINNIKQLAKKRRIFVALTNSDTFNPDDYFDIKTNAWPTDNLAKAIVDAQNLCKSHSP